MMPHIPIPKRPHTIVPIMESSISKHPFFQATSNQNPQGEVLTKTQNRYCQHDHGNKWEKKPIKKCPK
jgi:hypothetical protein